MNGALSLTAMAYLLLGGALAGGFIVLLVTRALARRTSGAAIREIVRAVEEIAEGRSDHLPPAEEGDPLEPISAALTTLAEAWRRRADEQRARMAALRGLLDKSRGVAFVGVDRSLRIRFASEGLRELLGHPPEELLGKPLERLFSDASWQELMRRLLPAEASGEAWSTLNARLRRRDGSEVGVVVTASEAGGPEEPGWFLTLRDSSDTEALERALGESEEKYRRLTEGLAEGVFMIQRGVLAYANSAMERLVGAAPGSLTGRPFRDFIASEDLLAILAVVAEVEQGGPVRQVECRLLPSAAGEAPRHARVAFSPARVGGRPVVIGSAEEIGGSLRSLRQLRASESRLDATLEATSDGILLMAGPLGRQTVAVANRRLRDVLGVDPADVFGPPHEEVGARIGRRLTDPQRFEAFFSSVCAAPEGVRTELFDLVQPAGRVVEVYSAPATGGGGGIVGRVFSFRDVTGREDLARSKAELEHAYAEQERMNGALREKAVELDRINQELRSLAEMRSSLLANISHELQMPLTAIKGYTDMILHERLGRVTEEQRRGLELSLRNTDRLIAMIENLMTLARAEKDMPGMHVATFALWDLVEECMDAVRERAEAARVTLTSRCLTDDLMVRGDRDKITQVFLNLLANAVKFNRPGGEVALSVRKGKRGYLLVEVRDSGIGIPPDDLEKIFERSFRVVSPETEGRAGSGLGLAIVRDLLRLHGCTIRADSRLGEGSVFTFTLPLATSQDSRSDAPPETSAETPPPVH